MIRRLAEDLRAAFPEMTGFSQRNLQYMRTVLQRLAEIDTFEDNLRSRIRASAVN